MDQIEQITRQTGLVPDVQAIEVSAVPRWFFRSLLAAPSASPLGDRPTMRFHIAFHTRDDRNILDVPPR